ncbi:MAG: VanW family protein [Ruthenibacterium sp.]
MKQRKLFCEISPLCYQISTAKNRALRRMRDAFSGAHFARTRNTAPLPHRIYRHASIIRRELANVDATLQNNKAVNLMLSAPRVNGILIRPGETFSFWRLVGLPSARRGYLTGLTIAHGVPAQDIGGGLCQFTNLLHWLILHTPLTITEHHHHDGVDLFPDSGRNVPFGTGTSILYNYLDYRFKNDTDAAFQLLVHADGDLLYGEIRSDQPVPFRYDIVSQDEHFVREADGVYRCGSVVRICTDAKTGEVCARTCIKQNHARVLYDTDGLVLREAADGKLH